MTEAHDHDRYLARMRNRQRAQALPLKQICAPNLRGASVHHSSRRSLCFAFLFSFFRKPSCARMRLSGNVSSRNPHEMRPQNKTMERHAGKGPRGEALGGTPRRNVQKCSKLASNVAFFFRTSAVKPTSPSLQLNITPGRFLDEIRTLSSPPKEHHIRGPF